MFKLPKSLIRGGHVAKWSGFHIKCILTQHELSGNTYNVDQVSRFSHIRVGLRRSRLGIGNQAWQLKLNLKHSIN